MAKESEVRRPRMHQVTAREGAVLMILVLETREDETGIPVTRARLSQDTVRKILCRSQVSPEFFFELQEILLRAGFAFFAIGSDYYAIIRLTKVEGWSRISSRRIDGTLAQVRRGEHIDGTLAEKWADYEDLLLGDDPVPAERQANN